MKNVPVIVLFVSILIILGLFLFSFQVRETEKAVVLRFKKAQRSIDEPGWKFKLPIPFEEVIRYDSRAMLYERKMEETTTRGGEPIIVTSYLIWRVDDPLTFYNTSKVNKVAEQHLYTLLGSAQNSIVGQYAFGDFINSDPSKVKFEQIEKDILDAINKKDADGKPLPSVYGIKVEAVGIKQLAISKSVTEDVFGRMREDRLRKSEEILASGESEAKRIRSDAEAKKTELLAIVEAMAKDIRGQGDAEAAKYYKMLEQDEDLAIFLRDLEALKKILMEKATIVLGTDVEPIKLLKGLPDIAPQN